MRISDEATEPKREQETGRREPMAEKVRMKKGRPTGDKGQKGSPATKAILVSDPKLDARTTVDMVLSDGLMIFLAIMMIPIVLLPTFFPLPQEVHDFLNASNLVILAIFYIEYFSKLYLAKDRKAHFTNFWHILDLIVITLPLLELFPILGITGTHSIILLRLLRILRLLTVGSRTIERRTHGEAGAIQEASKVSTMEIRAVDGSLGNVKDGIKFADLTTYLKDPKQTWIDISGVSDVDIVGLSKALDIPQLLLESKLVEEAYPRIDYLPSSSLVFLQAGQIDFPTEGKKYITVTKHGLLVVCAGSNIVTISRQKIEAFETILENARKRSKGDKALVVTVLYAVLDYVIEMYKDVVREIERELITLQNVPRGETPKDFLERTFELKKEVTKISSSLHHLKEVVGTITSKRAPLEGFDRSWEEIFDILLDETGYLYETTENSKENLLSIIELHINMTSYEMNKVMRVIAVITCLALIPSLVSGLLGMNVLGVPIPVHVWQIVSMTFIMMGCVAWIFYKLGWMRT
jgi:Mg2+ and Co2+ transporter CorA